MYTKQHAGLAMVYSTDFLVTVVTKREPFLAN
jgi:hypothetical protein